MKRILTAAIALSVLVPAGASYAQPGHGLPPPGQVRKYENRYADRGPPGYERHADKRYKAKAYRGPKGYYGQRYHRGERLDAVYLRPVYRVDYRRYRLAPPPRGYEYIRVNNDVMLTAMATGVITAVLIDTFN